MKLNITELVYLNTEISMIQYIFVKYLRFLVLILSDDLVTEISPTYICIHFIFEIYPCNLILGALGIF